MNKIWLYNPLEDGLNHRIKIFKSQQDAEIYAYYQQFVNGNVFSIDPIDMTDLKKMKFTDFLRNGVSEEEWLQHRFIIKNNYIIDDYNLDNPIETLQPKRVNQYDPFIYGICADNYYDHIVDVCAFNSNDENTTIHKDMISYQTSHLYLDDMNTKEGFCDACWMEIISDNPNDPKAKTKIKMSMMRSYRNIYMFLNVDEIELNAEAACEQTKIIQNYLDMKFNEEFIYSANKTPTIFANMHIGESINYVEELWKKSVSFILKNYGRKEGAQK